MKTEAEIRMRWPRDREHLAPTPPQGGHGPPALRLRAPGFRTAKEQVWAASAPGSRCQRPQETHAARNHGYDRPNPGRRGEKKVR